MFTLLCNSLAVIKEQYWRIDGQLKPGDLRRLVSSMSGSLVVDQQIIAISEDVEQDELSGDEKENRMSMNEFEGRDSDESKDEKEAQILAKQKREAALLSLARKRQEFKQKDEYVVRNNFVVCFRNRITRVFDTIYLLI